MEQAETQAAKLENGTKDDVNRLSRGRNSNFRNKPHFTAHDNKRDTSPKLWRPVPI